MQLLTLFILSCVLADMNLIASRSVHVSHEDVQDETLSGDSGRYTAVDPAGRDAATISEAR